MHYPPTGKKKLNQLWNVVREKTDDVQVLPHVEFVLTAVDVLIVTVEAHVESVREVAQGERTRKIIVVLAQVMEQDINPIQNRDTHLTPIQLMAPTVFLNIISKPFW